MGLLVNIALKIIVLGIVVKLVPGIKTRGFWSLVATAILLGLANTFLKPILVVLGLPIIFLTFGLFLIVINAAILKMVDGLMGRHFEIEGWGPAIVAAILLSIVSWLLEWFLGVVIF